ncbi:MAG: hypothetical protein HN368_24550, partial [Spirochaetales bacterium]|nr:hypothetical protein [Spirochaetales bacterium]
MNKKKIILISLLTILGFSGAFAQLSVNNPDNAYRLSLSYETGAVKVLSNKVQFGIDGTYFDYVTQGGEEILFPVQRFTGNLILAERHNIIFLYQPLTVETKVKIRDDVVIDGNTFSSGDSLLVKYGFPFWRLSYLYDFIDTPQLELGAGLSFQLRNASIVFESLVTGDMTVNQNLGPVPILKAWGTYRFDSGFFAGFEVDGFYASSKFFNGSDFSFTGSILDASVRAGLELRDEVDAFLNVRFLGGSAEGTSQYDSKYWTQGVEGYTKNYL